MVSDRIQRRIDRLLDQVEQEADNRNWEQVQTLATEVLAFDPENADAMSFITAAQRVLGVGTDAPEAERGSASSPQPSESSSAQPTSFSDGRYQVQRFLGEGGKKMVYLAQDTLLDRDVAFALIKTEGLDNVSRSRISREAQAMGRLGSHPHIVTVFDLGEHEGRPFMVVELLGGGDVEGVLEDAEGGRLSLEQAISIAVETCRGLEFAHSRGIIHRDLKPGNVWLTEDGIAKIGDFGLAVSLDRSRLTAEGMMVGTVSYMPPEQAMGSDVTPRADLYSLGAMLYEMVCGRPPFLGDDNIAIIGQHINTPPVAPTWHRSDCPRPLEALIMRLLSKDPSERPESASDVLAALEAVDVSSSEQSITEPEVALNVLDSLAGDVFVGRQREMDDLKAALEDALGGRGRMVTLVGEPGIGKTRTAQELATYAGLRGCQVLRGRCYEEQGVPPYWPWVQAFRSYVQDSDGEALGTELGASVGDLVEIVSDIRNRSPDVSLPLQLNDPEQERFRLFDSVCAFLKTASGKQPLIILLDDLQWSDVPSLLLLQFIARELSGTRILIVGTYRDADLGRRHPLVETLGELIRETLFERVRLHGLTSDDVQRFIEMTSDINPTDSLVQAVHGQTDGNPLFVTEVVRLLAQEGDLTPAQVRERDSWEIRVPEGVREVLGRRLNRLSERCNETLTIASVIGREFTLEQLDALSDDLNQDALLDVLEEGLSARVIEELPDGVGRYQFSQLLVQETLVDELSLTRRVRLHARIMEALEKIYAGDVDAHCAELAYHSLEAVAVAGPENMVMYSLMAGERAMNDFAFEEAHGYFERALSAKENREMDREKAKLLFALGRAQTSLLQTEDAHGNLVSAFEYFRQAGDISSAVEVATHPFGVGFTGVPELISSALEIVQEDSIDEARLLSQWGFYRALRLGEYDNAQNNFERTLTIARREGDQALEMWTLARAGRIAFFYLQPQQCIALDGRAAELNRELDDPNLESFSRMCVVGANLSVGDMEGAQVNSSAMLTMAERARHPAGLVAALWINSLVFLVKGKWDAAREVIDRGLGLNPSHGYLWEAKLLLEYSVGDYSGGEECMETLERLMGSRPPGPVESHVAVALTGLFSGEAAGDVERFKLGARSYLSSTTSHPYSRTEANMALSLIAVAQDDRSAAKTQYSEMEPWRHTVQDHSNTSIDRLLGLLARTIGEVDTSASHFEDALAFCRTAEYRPQLAWSLHDYSDMLLERNEPGDSEKAVSMLDEALQISTDLGMRPLMERVLSKRDILKA